MARLEREYKFYIQITKDNNPFNLNVFTLTVQAVQYFARARTSNKKEDSRKV